MKQKFSTRTLTQIGLMAALVFVGTYLRIKIPIGGDGTMLHLGNVFCILAGLLFGGIPGGLAAGFGSAIFDLTSEYAYEFWITFINKFIMAYVAGTLATSSMRFIHTKLNLWRPTIAAVAGSLSYTVLYSLKSIITSRFVQGLPWNAVWPVVSVKFAVSLTNGIIAVVVSLALYFALKPALEKAHLLSPVQES